MVAMTAMNLKESPLNLKVVPRTVYFSVYYTVKYFYYSGYYTMKHVCNTIYCTRVQ